MNDERAEASIALRDALHRFLAIRSEEVAEAAAIAALRVVSDFDFEAELERLAKRELERWCRDQLATVYRSMLTSKELHQAAEQALRSLITPGGQG